jgi:hypothetical protein
MEYEVYLRRESMDFLRRCSRKERDLLLGLLESLAKDPFQKGDFSESDKAGRAVEVLIFRGYAIVYWADHAVKEVKITDIRSADR